MEKDMMDLTIREITEACGGKLVLQGQGANSDNNVSSVVINSRLVEPKGVFIATVGERVDGHRFIPAAFAQGAVLAVTQKTPEEMGAVQSVRVQEEPVLSGKAEREEAGLSGNEGHEVAGMSGKAEHEGEGLLTGKGHEAAELSGAAVKEKAYFAENPGPEGADQTGNPEQPQPWGSYLLVEDTLQALKDIAEAYRKKLSVKVVGITGSVGKTSTKEFIAGVLSEKYRVLKTEGNFNNEIGVPLTLLSIRRDHEAAVVEMGISDFGEMHRLSKMVRPDICVITNIGQSHLNNLIDRDGILRAKSEIFDYMAEDGEICLNAEDDKLAALTEIKGHKPHFFGLGNHPEEEASMVDIVSRGLWGSDAVMVLKGTEEYGAIEKPMQESQCLEHIPEDGSSPEHGTEGYGRESGQEGRNPEHGTEGYGRESGQEGRNPEHGTEGYGRESGQEGRNPEHGTEGHSRENGPGVAVHIPLPGGHMVLNGAAAACVAGLMGMSPEEIAAGFGKVAAISGRANILRLPRYTLIDDCYNANPASVKAAIELLALADTEKVAILGDMLNLGDETARYHGDVGIQAVELGIERIVCVGELSRHMFREAKERRQEKIQACWFPDTDALLQVLAADRAGLVPDGSTVLIKASHDVGFAKVLEALREEAGRE